MRLPVRAIREAERLDAAARALGKRPRVGVIGAEQQQAPARDQVHEPLERQTDGVEVGVDVGVVVLDVVHDGDVGQVLEELRRLVEERAVVLVALDHELAAAADAIAALEVLGDAADEHVWIGAAMREQPSGQRRRRGFSVRAGDHDRAGSPEEMIADGLGKGAVPDLAIEDLLELEVATRDGVADDDEVDIRGDVFGAVALQRGDALLLAGSRSSAGRRSDPSRERRGRDS